VIRGDKDFFFSSPSSILEKYTIDLTKMATDGEFTKLVGRDKELKRMHNIILKKKKKNPLILGEAGVGKTALVEDLARSFLFDEDIHSDLKEVSVLQLDVNSMIAGTSARGELEERVVQLIDILSSEEYASNTILFIDEIHTLLSNGSGKSSNEGKLNICDLLKPSLARGEIQCIGATTYSEYMKFVKNDAAFDRRFNCLYLEEPDTHETLRMLESTKRIYEEYHKCVITKDALKKSVELANKYIQYRQFPDKAIDLIDEACSRCVLESHRTKFNLRIVDYVDIEAVVSSMLRIDVSSDNVVDYEHKLMVIQETLLKNIIGQEDAVEIVVNALKRQSSGMYNEDRPVCSMFFVGPTGVGKTELAKLLAREYYGNKQGMNEALIRFDMSEYMDKMSVSSLIGAPPGYIGYQDGGKLTRAVKHKPCSILLFDEIEKAHPDVLNILLQILEDGVLTDAYDNKKYSFKNNIIIMTSNSTSTERNNGGLGFELEKIHTVDNIHTSPHNVDNDHCDEMKHEVGLSLLSDTGQFRPEFLNRIDAIIPFNALTDSHLELICDKTIAETILFVKASMADIGI
jgi:ATP-dependent Clp protease ATP-binding subunit ClpA